MPISSASVASVARALARRSAVTTTTTTTTTVTSSSRSFSSSSISRLTSLSPWSRTSSLPHAVFLLPARGMANREQRDRDRSNMKKKQEKQRSAEKLKATSGADESLLASIGPHLDTLEQKVEAIIARLTQELSTFSSSRVSPSLLESIVVTMPDDERHSLLALGTISNRNASTLLVTLFDATYASVVEKTLREQKKGILGELTTQIEQHDDSTTVVVSFPKLTKENRDEMKKQMSRLGEDSKSHIRAHRQACVQALKREKLHEDDERTAKDRLQALVDDGIKRVENAIKVKEADIASV